MSARSGSSPGAAPKPLGRPLHARYTAVNSPRRRPANIPSRGRQGPVDRGDDNARCGEAAFPWLANSTCLARAGAERRPSRPRAGACPVRALHGARRGGHGDRSLADLCAARRRRPLRECLLARDAGSAAAVGLGAIRGRERAAVAALRARDDPLGPGLRRDPHLLAPVDHAHERRQRHFLRDDRADLGRAVRLAPRPPAPESGGPHWPRPVPARRRGVAGAELPAQACRSGRRPPRHRDWGLLRPLLPCRAGGAEDDVCRAGHFRSDADHSDHSLRRRSRDRADNPAALRNRARGAHRHGLDQPFGRAGAACYRARPAAGDFLVARHLPGGDRRGGLRLGGSRRAGLARPGAWRRHHPRRHFRRAATVLSARRSASLGRPERREQRLRLGDLWHFGRQRVSPLPFGRGVGGEGRGPASSGRSPSSPTLLRGEGGDANHSSADASTAWASAGRAVDW